MSEKIDVAVMAFSVGSVTSLWLGYKLRQRVERWQAGRAKRARQAAKITPSPSPGYGTILAEQDARFVIKKPRHVPLAKRPSVNPRAPWGPSAEVIPIIRDPSKIDPIPLPVAPLKASLPVCETRGRMSVDDAQEMVDAFRQANPHVGLYVDVVAALVDAGFKRSVAHKAVADCTPEERAGGLESWVVAALRRASSKP